MQLRNKRLARVLIGLTTLVSLSSVRAEVLPMFTEHFDAFDARTDFGDGETFGVEEVEEADSPFNDGLAFRMFDLNTGDKPELQGEFFEPVFDPFRIDFQSYNQSMNDSSSAIRFRMANAGLNIGSEGRVAFSLSWQADGRLTAKYELEDGTVGTHGIFLARETVTDVTLVANPNQNDTYTYMLFGEERTLDTNSYDVFIDELLFSAEFENGMPFHLTRSEAEFDPALGISRFGLTGSSNSNVDPDYLFDNIIFRTGDDIASGGGEAPKLGDANLDGEIDVNDIDVLTKAIQDGTPGNQFDINGDGDINDADRNAWVKDVMNTWIGDSNLDGEFNSGDFVQVFSFGQYEDGEALNSTWSTGDWSGDSEFTSSDFVAAFSDSGFEEGPRPSVAIPEPSNHAFVVFTMQVLLCQLRCRKA